MCNFDFYVKKDSKALKQIIYQFLTKNIFIIVVEKQV